MQVFPYSFIRKSNLDKDLNNVLNKIKELLEPKIITIESNKTNYEIKTSQILYIEKIGRYSYVCLDNQVFQTKQPLKYYSNILDDNIFEYVSQSVLVNVNNIIRENNEAVIMKDNKMFYYSRGRRKILRAKYINQKMKYN